MSIFKTISPFAQGEMNSFHNIVSFLKKKKTHLRYKSEKKISFSQNIMISGLTSASPSAHVLIGKVYLS